MTNTTISIDGNLTFTTRPRITVLTDLIRGGWTLVRNEIEYGGIQSKLIWNSQHRTIEVDVHDCGAITGRRGVLSDLQYAHLLRGTIDVSALDW